MPSNSNSNFNLTNSDNENVQRIMRAEMQKRMGAAGLAHNFESIVRNAAGAVERYLRTTRIPYVAIGGKAAAAHLVNVDMNARNRALVASTNDFDICVERTFVKAMVDGLAHTLRQVVPSHMLREQQSGDILLMGIERHGMLESLVDVHVVAKLPPATTIGGVRYATIPWLLDQFARHPPSANNIVKAVKRQRREHHLRRRLAF